MECPSAGKVPWSSCCESNSEGTLEATTSPLATHSLIGVEHFAFWSGSSLSPDCTNAAFDPCTTTSASVRLSFSSQEEFVDFGYSFLLNSETLWKSLSLECPLFPSKLCINTFSTSFSPCKSFIVHFSVMYCSSLSNTPSPRCSATLLQSFLLTSKALATSPSLLDKDSLSGSLLSKVDFSFDRPPALKVIETFVFSCSNSTLLSSKAFWRSLSTKFIPSLSLDCFSSLLQAFSTMPI